MSALNLTPRHTATATPEQALVRLTVHAARTREIRAHGDDELTRTAETLCRVLARRATRAGADALTVALVLDNAGVDAPVPFAPVDAA
jgi:hypothetical protein